MRVLSFLKSERLRCLTIVLNVILLGTHAGTISFASDSDACKEMNVFLQKVSIRSVPGSDRWRMCLDLALTNRTADTFVILPSEMAVEYRLEYPDGESDTEKWGSQTVSTSARNIAEIDVPVVRLEPGAMRSLSLCEVVTSQPRVGSGLLVLSLRCSPFYPDAAPAEGLVFRQELRVQSKVHIVYNPTLSEYIITPSSLDNLTGARPAGGKP